MYFYKQDQKKQKGSETLVTLFILDALQNKNTIQWRKSLALSVKLTSVRLVMNFDGSTNVLIFFHQLPDRSCRPLSLNTTNKTKTLNNQVLKD